MKIWKIIKALLYLTAGIVLLVFHDVATNYAGYIVGGVVAAYAIESVVFSIIKKDYFGRHGLLFEGSVRLLLGVILIISSSVLATFMKVGPQRASGVRIVCVRPTCCFEPRIATVDLN